MFPCAAMCRLLVSHGGSLHVPERMIWAAAWHGRRLGSWHGHVGPNSGLSKNPAVLIRIKPIISLSLLSVFPSIDLTPSLPSSSSHPPPSFLSHPCICALPAALSPARASLLHLYLYPHPLKRSNIKDAPKLAGPLPRRHFFSFMHLIHSKQSLGGELFFFPLKVYFRCLGSYL